jgi:hypothetical protein
MIQWMSSIPLESLSEILDTSWPEHSLQRLPYSWQAHNCTSEIQCIEETRAGSEASVTQEWCRKHDRLTHETLVCIESRGTDSRMADTMAMLPNIQHTCVLTLSCCIPNSTQIRNDTISKFFWIAFQLLCHLWMRNRAMKPLTAMRSQLVCKCGRGPRGWLCGLCGRCMPVFGVLFACVFVMQCLFIL